MTDTQIILNARQAGKETVVNMFRLLGGDEFLQASSVKIVDAGIIEGRAYIHMELSITRPNMLGASFATVQTLPDGSYKWSFWNNHSQVFHSVSHIQADNVRQRFTDLVGLPTGAV